MYSPPLPPLLRSLQFNSFIKLAFLLHKVNVRQIYRMMQHTFFLPLLLRTLSNKKKFLKTAGGAI